MNISKEEAPTKEMLSVEQVWLPCAWCLSAQGLPAGDGSHGICRQHANGLLLEQRSRRIAIRAKE